MLRGKCNLAATSSGESKVHNLYTFDDGLIEAESDFEVRYVSVRDSEALNSPAVVRFEEPDQDVVAVASQNRRSFIEADVEGFEGWDPDKAKDGEGAVGRVNGEVLEVVLPDSGNVVLLCRQVHVRECDCLYLLTLRYENMKRSTQVLVVVDFDVLLHGGGNIREVSRSKIIHLW
jgi:hypothetical protein